MATEATGERHVVAADVKQDGTVLLHVTAATVGCSTSAGALKVTAERALKARLPEVTSVQAAPSPPSVISLDDLLRGA